MQPYRSEFDRRARTAFELYCRAVGSYAAAAERHGIDRRTARRMFRQERTVPPGLALEIARHIEGERQPAIAHLAGDLRAWSESQEVA